MLFKKVFQTPVESTPGINTKKYIIVHHTGTKHGTINGVLDGLYRRPDYASCHFVVDINGDKYQIGKPENILWHAGKSQWGTTKNLNICSIGIEVVGGAGEPFPFAQRSSVKELIQYLMAEYNIPKENVLRHADITQLNGNSAKKILWDGKSPARKTDISDIFWNNKYKSWKDYQDSCKVK